MTDVELDGQDHATIADCLHFLEDAITEGELPFDPTDMDEDRQEQWLADIAAAERAINPYAEEGGDDDDAEATAETLLGLLRGGGGLSVQLAGLNGEDI